MSRPLIENPERRKEAAEFHRIVFATYGNKCYFCRGHATDAMHIVPRSQLGPKLRYACPIENGRPGCRKCHDKKLPFKRVDVNRAVRALNRKKPKVRFQEIAA